VLEVVEVVDLVVVVEVLVEVLDPEGVVLGV
jgi:hypothetical protein